MAIAFNSKGGLQVSVNHCFSLGNKQKNVHALTHKRVHNENFSEEYLNEKIQTLVQENQIHTKINRSKPLLLKRRNELYDHFSLRSRQRTQL